MNPLMLRITDGKKRKYISLKVGISESEWNKSKGELKVKRPRKQDQKGYQDYQNYNNLKKTISEVENKYLDKIDELSKLGQTVTIDRLIELTDNPIKKVTVNECFDERISYLELKGRIGTSKSYRDAKNSLSRYLKNEIYFYELDKPLLRGYKDWMEEGNLSGSTMGIYLRTIRAVYNYAIESNYASINDYPFGKNSILNDVVSNSNKRAITKADVMKIAELKLEDGSKLKDAQNYFLFGYYASGINFADLASLSWGDIRTNRVEFFRQKTVRSKKKQELISIKITPAISEILSYYRVRTGLDSKGYIFPILDRNIHKEEKQQFYRKKRVRKELNNNLKIIAKRTGIDEVLTSYVWRHTFASVAKNELKASIPVISEMMGHSNISTTESYLKGFDHSEYDKLSDAL